MEAAQSGWHEPPQHSIPPPSPIPSSVQGYHVARSALGSQAGAFQAPYIPVAPSYPLPSLPFRPSGQPSSLAHQSQPLIFNPPLGGTGPQCSDAAGQPGPNRPPRKSETERKNKQTKEKKRKEVEKKKQEPEKKKREEEEAEKEKEDGEAGETKPKKNEASKQEGSQGVKRWC